MGMYFRRCCSTRTVCVMYLLSRENARIILCHVLGWTAAFPRGERPHITTLRDESSSIYSTVQPVHTSIRRNKSSWPACLLLHRPRLPQSRSSDRQPPRDCSVRRPHTSHLSPSPRSVDSAACTTVAPAPLACFHPPSPVCGVGSYRADAPRRRLGIDHSSSTEMKGVVPCNSVCMLFAMDKHPN